MTKRIIIADDSEPIRKIVSTYLNHKNIETELCKNGEELLEKMKQASYDLVLTDYEMNSHIDGLEVTRRIRKDFGNGIPIYIMSGREIAKEALEAGASGYFHKPFDLAALDILVGRLQPTQQDSQSYAEQ